MHRGWGIGLIEAFILLAQALNRLSPAHASQSLRNTACLANGGGWNALHRAGPLTSHDRTPKPIHPDPTNASRQARHSQTH